MRHFECFNEGNARIYFKTIGLPQFIIVDGKQKLNAKLGQISSAGKKFTIEEINC
jgi:hypothetical protein